MSALEPIIVYILYLFEPEWVLIYYCSINKNRKASSPCQQSFDYVGETNDKSLLKPGDIYVTCHSNLSCAQVIFHLVSDKTLETTDINSRHPCVNGLRNCIRLAARNAINTLTFPLFLVEEMKPVSLRICNLYRVF